MHQDDSTGAGFERNRGCSINDIKIQVTQGQYGLTSCGQRTTLPLSEHDKRTRVLHSGAVRKFILLLTFAWTLR